MPGILQAKCTAVSNDIETNNAYANMQLKYRDRRTQQIAFANTMLGVIITTVISCRDAFYNVSYLELVHATTTVLQRC